MPASRWLFALGALASVGAVSCAGISKKYESDVRFERCWALDYKKDVDPTIRNHCWEDWLNYFAYGQTRDRMEYAKAQVSGAPVSSEAVGSATAPIAVGKALPEPTSVFTPVPVMATPSASSSASTSAARPVERSACETRCDKTLEACLAGCGSGVCEKFCAQKHGRCAGKCKGA